jgi:hypothetical protein
MVTPRMQYKQQNKHYKIERFHTTDTSSIHLSIDHCQEHTYPIHTPDYNMAPRNRKRNRTSSHETDDNADVISISSTEPDPEEQLQPMENVRIKIEPGVNNLVENPQPTIMQRVVPSMTPYAKYIYRVAGIYIFWILLHYITAHLYVKYCAASSLYGLLISPFLISSPHCIAMRWVFSKGGTIIEGMWIIVGTWLCSKLITQ